MTLTLRPYQQDKRLKPNSPKQVATRNGLVTFQGKACKRGHTGLRYTKGGQCIECVGLARGKTISTRNRSSKNIELAKQAELENKTTYAPAKPCRYGHSLRFVNSNNCVACDEVARERHKISAKYARIKKEYGLTKEEYLNLVKSQNSSCKLCGVHKEDHFQLHIDHCHDTTKVRSLLCGKCNQGIGLLNHNPELIRKAALYCEGSWRLLG